MPEVSAAALSRSLRPAQSVKAELLLLTVSDGSAAVMGYHSMSGSLMLVSPSESVPLFAGRMAFAVPLSMTVVGEKALPAETLSRPSRTPGCEGAKLIRREQEELAARAEGHWLCELKSRVMMT